MRNYKTQDRYRAKNPEELSYYCAGIPIRYWKDEWVLEPIPFIFENGDGKSIAVEPKKQRIWIAKMSEIDYLRRPYLIIVGGVPTDEKAMALASRIVKIALKQGVTCHVFDVAGYDKPRNSDQLVVMYNLSSTAYTSERMMNLRDMVIRYEDRFRILVVEGNPGEFAFQVLKIRPNAVIGLQGSLCIQRSL